MENSVKLGKTHFRPNRFQVSAGLLSSDNEQGATTLADELMTRQKSVAQAESQLQTCEMSLQHLRQQLKAKTNEMNQTEKDYRSDAQASKHLENDVTKSVCFQSSISVKNLLGSIRF